MSLHYTLHLFLCTKFKLHSHWMPHPARYRTCHLVLDPGLSLPSILGQVIAEMITMVPAASPHGAQHQGLDFGDGGMLHHSVIPECCCLSAPLHCKVTIAEQKWQEEKHQETTLSKLRQLWTYVRFSSPCQELWRVKNRSYSQNNQERANCKLPVSNKIDETFLHKQLFE